MSKKKMNSIQVALQKVLTKNINFKKHSVISIALIVVGAIMSFYGTNAMSKAGVKFLSVLKPGRYVRKLMENKVPFTYKLYLWNVTNPVQIAAGTEKPKMQEIGPYVFSQIKRKIDTSDNNTEDTYSFNLLNIYNFNPELSAPLTGDEIITTLDLVLVASAIKVKIERPHQMNFAVEALDIIFEKPTSIFVTMKAIDFIDKGFEVKCDQTAYAAKAACAEMRRSRLLKTLNENKTLLRHRWFDRLNNSVQARYTVLRGTKNVHDIGRLVALNDKPKLGVFKELQPCNIINGTDKLFFPPLQKKSDVIWIYSEDSCKSIPLRYTYTESVRAVTASFKNGDLGDRMMDPACECNKFIGCTPKGTVNMHPCLEIFVLGSFPNFHLSDPSILETMEGMNPKEDLHKCGIYFDLVTGQPILTFERFQITILVQRIPEYPIFSSIANGNVWIPMLWYEESYSISKFDLALVKLTKISKILGVVTGYIMMSIGLLGLGVLAARFHYHSSTRPESE